MDGIRKIGNSTSFENSFIHPIFLTYYINKKDYKLQPIIPKMINNKLEVASREDKEKLNLKQLSNFMEKPYTSIDSNLILDLKKITNLVDFENKLKNNEFKTDNEFRYYFNIFIRKKLNTLSTIQMNLLVDFMVDYFKKIYNNTNKEKVSKLIEKWKVKEKTKDFNYKFIEYLDNKLNKKI